MSARTTSTNNNNWQKENCEELPNRHEYLKLFFPDIWMKSFATECEIQRRLLHLHRLTETNKMATTIFLCAKKNDNHKIYVANSHDGESCDKDKFIRHTLVLCQALRSWPVWRWEDDTRIQLICIQPCTTEEMLPQRGIPIHIIIIVICEKHTQSLVVVVHIFVVGSACRNWVNPNPILSSKCVVCVFRLEHVCSCLLSVFEHTHTNTHTLTHVHRTHWETASCKFAGRRSQFIRYQRQRQRQKEKRTNA